MSYSSPTVSAPTGIYQGIGDTEVNKFLGIRYAKPPTGEARFKAPQSVDHYDGAIDATQFGNRSLQAKGMESLFGTYTPPGAESEDCLFLNIYTPANNNENAKAQNVKPVLVWIHGGAFVGGSGHEFDASKIVADNDVIVVTVNYRLGIFGFLNLQRLGAEFKGSANLGIQDQIASLQWINKNIAAFGGDASNVTVWGESAGACSILALLGAPRAEGLFQRAIAFSGYETVNPPIDQLDLVKAHLETDSDTECLAKLMAMSAEELAAVQHTLPLSYGVSLDQTVITRPASEAIKEGHAKNIPIILGNTQSEGPLLTIAFGSAASAIEMFISLMASTISRDDGSSYLSHLNSKAADSHPKQRMNQMWQDLFRSSATRVAAAASSHGAGGWVYNFDVETDHPLGIAHASEIPFTFNWVSEDNPLCVFHQPTPINIELASKWSRTLIEFAKSGSPNGHGLPDWPQYTAEAYQCLRLSQQPAVIDNPDGNMLSIYQVK
ncbi:carboxylesterase/lipase family protein [Maricurvus nonylphenolicus]|uniref:carboxylesterase/lipase family protein n=1 Tax=Maricurvus nonylphenolicus TaxID=1008307 RepID=UPI0036F2CE0C